MGRQEVLSKVVLVSFISLIFLAAVGPALAGDGQIDIASLPYTISSSGSYVVVDNITLSTQNTHGITISANNVTLDLNGHTLTGPGKAAGSSGSGIYVGSTRYNIVVKNGTMRDWRWQGVEAYNGLNCIFEDLIAYNNGNYGISAGSSALIRGNVCRENGSTGIYAISSVGDCVISDNVCYYNGYDGISAYRATVTNNVCTSNTNHGMSIKGPSTVIGNNCSQNSMVGIMANSPGGVLIENNVCNLNLREGITLNGSGSRVVGNTCNSNGWYGINSQDAGGDVIQNNLVVDNVTYGIRSTTACFVAGNRASGNGTDYLLTGVFGTTFGQIVDMTAGGTIATTDPYANFRF
ncbi:MAG: right-handed parallel beta-helix repeat-containing protein [bacterium]